MKSNIDMPGIGSKRPAHVKKILVCTAVAVTLVGLGVLAGYFIGQQATTANSTNRAGGSNNLDASDPDSASMDASTRQELLQLPQPGSTEAQQLLSSPDTPEWVKDHYIYYSDSQLITGPLSAAFLRQFEQQQQQQQPQQTTSELGAGGAAFNTSSSAVDLAQFVRVADDLLNYLRFWRSEALLSLLREFSTRQTLAVESVDPDQLQQEVRRLLKLESLNKWYAARWGNDGVGDKQAPAARLTNTQQGTAFMISGSPDNTGRRLLNEPKQHVVNPTGPNWHTAAAGAAAAAAAQQQQQQQQHHGKRPSRSAPAGSAAMSGSSSASATRAAPQTTRRLQAAMAASIPAIPAAQAAAAKIPSVALEKVSSSTSSTSNGRSAGGRPVAGILPTESPQQSLQDMLCSIAPYSPAGLKGMLPVSTNKSSSNTALACPRKPSGLRVFAFKGVVFKPVTIPIVIHCLRYVHQKTIMPPMWDPHEAANNIIDITNRYYKDTGIQFSLLDVRHDPKHHPYLLLPSLEAWQACSANQPEYESYFPCLSKKAQNGSAALMDGPNRYAIHVFVSGARDIQSLCDVAATPAPVCASLFAGYSNAEGPWFTGPSESWTEDSVDENWVFITWDMFNPQGRNSARFWDGGGCTLAHELGHFLGLRHTHHGEKPCEGDGLNKADAVPDTPNNQQVDEYAASQNLLAALTGWCVDFRTGKQPAVSELAPFNSCKRKQGIDNIFNLLSYTMDPCCLMLTQNQVARLQWAIASFRPKMMKAFAVA